jgi:hypothetical protein
MTRLALLPLLLCPLLAGCSISNDVPYSIVSGKDTTSLSIYRSKIGVYINPHGGRDSDSYSFTFPKTLTHIKAADIASYHLNYQDKLADLSQDSQIDLNVNSQGCEISVSVFSRDGRPLPINGRHWERECGQNVSAK